MNKFMLVAVAATVAGFAAPSAMAATAAAPAPQGYIMGGGGSLSSGGTSINAFGAGGAIDFRPMNLDVEIEGMGSRLSVSGTSIDFGKAAVHIFYRTPDQAFGAFAGYQRLTVPAFSSSALNIWTIGAEAQLYMKQWAFSGQVGFDNSKVSGKNVSQFYWRATAQLFLTDNFMLQADAKEASALLFTTSNKTWQFAATAQFRLPNTPLGVFAAVRETTVDGGGSGNQGTTVLGGVSFQFGNSTLKQQYTKGASMSTLPFIF